MKEDKQTPRIETQVTCGHCDEKWWYSFKADQEKHELECPGCGEPRTTEKGDK